MNNKLDLATVAGIISGLGLLILAIFLGGGAGIFFNVPSLLIVVGGTVAATLINFPLREVVRVMKVAPKAFKSSFEEPTRIMEKLVLLCAEAKKQGFLGLEAHVDKIDNMFFKSGVNMVIDGIEPEQIRATLRLQTMAMQERHKTGRNIFEGMGQWAPAFGMIGTLIGLVQMMANMTDPSAIGPKMAVALLSTFYGVFACYGVFTPLAKKLERKHKHELLYLQMVVKGIIWVQTGDSPRILEGKMRSFLREKAS